MKARALRPGFCIAETQEGRLIRPPAVSFPLFTLNLERVRLDLKSHTRGYTKNDR
jgi:hypothetical protein